jgi:hypothetical protein
MARLFAATVTYYLVEKPAVNYARRIPAKKEPSIPSDPEDHRGG